MALETDKILPSGLRRRTSVSGNILTIETSDPNSDRILAENQKWRNEGLIKKRPDLHFAISMPEFEYYMLMRRYPDLDSKDSEICTKAWKKWIASSESRPYRVT